MKKFFFFYSMCVTTTFVFAMEQSITSIWDGKKYSQNNQPQFKRAMEILNGELFNTKNVARAKVIDIGCGSGNITYEVSQRTAHVVGIDASESMIQTAKQQYKDIKNLRFQQQDATIFNPEFVLSSDPKNGFNYVTCFACLHWIKDKAAVIKNIAQYIAPQGIFLASIGSKDAQNPVIRALNDLKTSGPETVKALLQKFDPSDYYFPIDKSEMHTLLTKAHFKSIDIQEESETSFFENKDQFSTWLSAFLGSFGALAKLPETPKKAFFDLLTEKYVAHVQLTEKGEIPYKIPAIIVKASLVQSVKK